MTYWIRQSWTNVERRYHTDKDCHALARADGEPKQATESEVQAYTLCKWCCGDVEQSTSGVDYHRQLLEADPEDVGADVMGGQP